MGKAGLSVVLAVGACLSWAVAASAADVSPLVIPAAALRTDSTGVESYSYEDYGYLRGVGETVALFAPVYLPDGAVVTRLEAYIIDPTDSCAQAEIRVYLERTSFEGEMDPVPMAGMQSSVNSPDIRVVEDTSIQYATVDNQSYSYYLQVSLCHSLHYLFAVRVHYVD